MGRSDRLLVATFAVFGKPVAWQRAGTRSGRYYVVRETVEQERLVGEEANAVLRSNLLEGAVGVELWFIRQWPKSVSVKRRTAQTKAITRPDTDNYVKTILDGLNGIAYQDDAQVVDLRAYKLYGDEPRTVIQLWQVLYIPDVPPLEGGRYGLYSRDKGAKPTPAL